jgi:hypothetical protein
VNFDEFKARDARRFVANLEDELRRSHPGEPLARLDVIDGSDASGTVYCSVRLAGGLIQVGIMDGWWRAVGPRSIAATVLQALGYAREKAGIAQLVLARHGRSLPKPDLPTIESGYEPPLDDVAEWADAARRKIDRAAAVFATVDRLARQAGSNELREVTGPRGMFRVQLLGIHVVGATVNEYGLRPEDAADLADDAREALLAAQPSMAIGRSDDG